MKYLTVSASDLTSLLTSPIQIESIESMHYQSDDQETDTSSNLNNVLSQMLAAQMSGSSGDLSTLARLGFPQLQQARLAIEAHRQKPSFSGKILYIWSTYCIFNILYRSRGNNN